MLILPNMSMEENIKQIKSVYARDEAMYEILENTQMDQLIQCFRSNDKRLAEKSSWILQEISNQYPEALLPYGQQLIAHLNNCNSDAEKRFIMRYYNFQPLPDTDKELTQLMNTSFDWLMNPKEAIAQRAFAMTVLYRISEKIPEIKSELIAVIEAQMEMASSGLKNRAKHTLVKLYKTLQK